MGKAMAARADRQPNYNESARFLHGYCAKHDKDYVMWAMDYASLCLLGGNYDAARAELLDCYKDITGHEDKDKENVAAISDERAKLFKGEPFERAMLCSYLGLIYYMEGDYGNARVFFTQVDMQNATKADNMKDYRHDFQLGHYWLGRTYLKLGQEDNARIAFTKASQRVPISGEDGECKNLCAASTRQREKRMQLEEQSYKEITASKQPVAGAVNMAACPSEAELPAAAKEAKGQNPVELSAANPAQFFSVDYQKEVNLVLFIEIGTSPIKYLTGPEGCLNAIARSGYAERKVTVYLDGHKAGSGVQLVDMYRQGRTRGSGAREKDQIAKGLSKAVLKQLPYAGMVAGLWPVSADDRYWHLLPGEVHVYAAKVKPGVYTVNLQCLDPNSYLLPRYSLTTYSVPVKEGQENIYILHTKPEADNVYVEAKK